MPREPVTQPTKTSPPPWKSPRHIAGTVSGIILLTAVILFWTGRSRNNPHRTEAAPLKIAPKVSKTKITPEENPDTTLISSLPGSWTREYHGQWLMTVKKGGIGSLVIKPSGQWSFLIGEKVEIQLKWSVQEGRATLHSVSGEPEAAFTAANLIFGDKRVRKIKELTSRKLVLMDEEDNSEDVWTRAPAATQ